MRAVGICLGASSVSLVVINNDNKKIEIEETKYKLHNGNPKEIFSEYIKSIKDKNLPLIVTGRKFRNIVNFTNISEPEAIENVIEQYYKEFKLVNAVASLGGETFVVYHLDNYGRISDISSKNQCASGTGEFFLQQVKRMDMSITDAVNIDDKIQPFKVSGRCSVFCKSDCTHALNKGVPKQSVASGLSLMIAEKVEDLLNIDKNSTIMLIGGVTKNSVVTNYIKNKYINAFIPEESIYFEALGAAIYGLNHSAKKINDVNEYFKDSISSFTFHKPLRNFENLVTFKEMNKGWLIPNEEYILGLDVGSTTTKAVLINRNNSEIVASVYLYTNGDPIGASRKCYQSILEQVGNNINIIGIGTTGSGRHISGIHALTEGVVNEIVAHATAAVHFDPEVDTIFEIGGQDAKYTYIVNRVPADYAMNEACSAGTGSFIEESAYESLGINVRDIQDIAMRADNPPNFSDQCAAFISSDIKTALQENISKEDITAGLVYSVCLNYVNRVKANRKTGNKIFMQGGVCYNKSIPIAMAGLTGSHIIVPPEPGLMGAFGVALVIKERLENGLIEKSNYSLMELAERTVTYHKPFTCLGGKEKCDLKCSINIIEVAGKRFPFGGSCNKYYNLNVKQKFPSDEYDFVKRRQYLTFRDYIELPKLDNAKTVGMNLSFQIYNLLPLFNTFFREIGFNLILSERYDNEGMNYEISSMCYPAQLSLGMFHNLLDLNPDYIFLPSIYEMETEPGIHQRLDFNCTCVFVSGEPMYLKQSFKDKLKDKHIISPTLNFGNGYNSQEKHFINIANSIGIKNNKLIKAAYEKAILRQRQYENDLSELGKIALDLVENMESGFASVIFGRAYNSFTDNANKGIPQKFATKGIYTIPYDIINIAQNNYPENMYWESGKKILNTAKFVANHPKLFATYITNFSCGPDSMIMTSFREIMGNKPSLTLELDGHTADAGVNTRIDASIDIINNFIKLKNVSKKQNNFRSARVEFAKNDCYFVDSDGNKTSIRDNAVKLLIPSMGDLNAEMFAAALRSLGYNCEALPPSNSEIVKLGKSVASGKECLPVILLAGSLLDYLNRHPNEDNKIALFNVQGAGNCRLGQYPVFLKHVIESKQLRNVAQATLMNEDGFAGFGQSFAKYGIQAIMIGDVLDDLRSAIYANSVNPEKGEQVFIEEFAKLKDSMEKDPDDIFKSLLLFAENIKKKVPVRTKIEDAKYIALLGEIYVRRDLYTHKFLNRKLAEKGFVLKIAHISEWIYYVDYLIKHGYLEPETSIKKKVEREVRSQFMHYTEKKIKRILAKSGYYKYSPIKIKPLLDHSKHIIPLEFKGEPGLTLGTALYESFDKYCGIINIGPFGCMPTRFTESVTIPEMQVRSKIEARRINEPGYTLNHVFNGDTKIPFLTLEVDGNPFPQLIESKLETFALQAARSFELMKKNKELEGVG